MLTSERLACWVHLFVPADTLDPTVAIGQAQCTCRHLTLTNANHYKAWLCCNSRYTLCILYTFLLPLNTLPPSATVQLPRVASNCPCLAAQVVQDAAPSQLNVVGIPRNGSAILSVAGSV